MVAYSADSIRLKCLYCGYETLEPTTYGKGDDPIHSQHGTRSRCPACGRTNLYRRQ